MTWRAEVPAYPKVNATRGMQKFYGEGSTPMAAYREAMEIVGRHDCRQSAKAKIRMERAA